MSKTIEIKRQRFEFGDVWRTYKTDDEPDLLKIKQGVDGTKDTDIVALWDNRRLFLMEVTDLRGFRIENRDKLSRGPMVQEFVQKIRETIPAIVGAFHSAPHKDQWDAFVEKLVDRNERIYVVLWMEQDTSRNPYERKRRANEMSAFVTYIKKHLGWLKPHVLVESMETYGQRLGDLRVTNLAGVGQHS